MARPLRGSRALMMLLGASFVIPFMILLALLALKVRLGQGYFAYRYSPVRDLRTPRALIGIVIGLIACGAIWCLARCDRRRVGTVLLFSTFVLWGAWSFWAPPQPMTQQMFNLTSPSTDGAFVAQSEADISLPAYLRAFDDNLRLSVKAMNGTRVLSNPPGMTIVARLVSDCPIGRAWLERWLVEDAQVAADDAKTVGDALRVAMALCALWALSGMAAFGLGRVFLSPAGAAVFAILVTFTPCALDFVPGKDPAQLLTINAMLWAWFSAWKRRSVWLAALAGAIGVIGTTMSLVHVWVGLIMVAVVVWEDRHVPCRGLIALACGKLAVIGIVYFTIGWNIPATLLAVSRRWSEIQTTFEMSRPIWFAIGLPIFLLFLAPGFWALLGLSIRRPRMNVGTRLAICTAAVMLLIYVVVGMTYELPRLWVAFLPPLVLGLGIDRPLLRGHGKILPRPAAMALVLIVLAQIAFTAIHWTLLDARETEYRLMSERFYH